MSGLCKSRCSFIFFIVKRFIKSKYVSPYQMCLYRAFWTVVVACGIIVTLDSIINGMHRETVNSLKGIHADMRITLPQEVDSLQLEKIMLSLKNMKSNNAYEVDVIGTHYGIVQYQKKMLPVTILVIDDFEKNSTMPFKSWLVKETLSDEVEIKGNKVALGIGLARALECALHDRLNLVFSGILKGHVINCEHCTVRCEVLFQSGEEEVDRQVVFMHAKAFENLTDLFPFTHILINTKPHLIDKALKQEQKLIENALGLPVQKWSDTYSSLAHALELERLCAHIMLGLLVLLSSITSYALLALFLSEKVKHFVSLVVMGAPWVCVFFITISISMITLIFASFIGCFFAALLSYICDTYHLIALPKGYYHNFLPLQINLTTTYILIPFHGLIGLMAGLLAGKNSMKNSISATAKNYQ